MNSDKLRGAIWRWVKEGPNDTDGTIGWALAMMLWWRMWGFVYASLAGMLVAAAVAEYVLNAPLVAGYFVALFLSPRLLNISGKYNVTKNY